MAEKIIALLVCLLLATFMFGCQRQGYAPPTREMVLARIEQEFPEEQRAEVIALVDRYGQEDYERERERVQLAILTLAEGDLNKVRKYVEVAKTDYRDVLYWAEY